ncbi:MAG: amidohydrolase family protein, partial [Actinomycetota bacterium]
MTPRAGRRIDAHLHVWDLDRSDYAWVTPALGDLHATFTPEQARAAMDACSVDDAVLVQAEDSERDTELMLEAADLHRWIVGVVGWVRLDDPATAAEQLDRWQQHPAFCGVRHLLHEERREDFLALPMVRRSLRFLAQRGIPFEVPDAWPRH